MFSIDLKNIFIEAMLQIESNTIGNITFKWSMQSLHIQDPPVSVNNMQMRKKYFYVMLEFRHLNMGPNTSK